MINNGKFVLGMAIVITFKLLSSSAFCVAVTDVPEAETVDEMSKVFGSMQQRSQLDDVYGKIMLSDEPHYALRKSARGMLLKVIENQKY